MAACCCWEGLNSAGRPAVSMASGTPTSPCSLCCSAHCMVPSSTRSPQSTSVLVETLHWARWQWTVGKRATAPPALLGSSEVSERKWIKTSGVLLGSVVYQLMYQRRANHGPGRGERSAARRSLSRIAASSCMTCKHMPTMEYSKKKNSNSNSSDVNAPVLKDF